jgi:hypothetical protein
MKLLSKRLLVILIPVLSTIGLIYFIINNPDDQWARGILTGVFILFFQHPYGRIVYHLWNKNL